ncbi:MAG: hypothetical protein ACTSUE_05820 [Promethearchaeota archaeon]
MTYEDEYDQDIDEDSRMQEDEFSAEDIEREASSRLMVERGEPLPIKKIIVNFWLTKAHGAKVGIKKAAQWQSKSRQFNPEMEIVGDVLYEFDEDKLVSDHALKYWEVEEAKRLNMDLKDIKADPKIYEKMILKPFESVPTKDKRVILDKNNERIPKIPPENDRKLIIAINERYWDTKKPDKSKMEEVDIDNDGKADRKKFLENYLVRKFGEFADLNRRVIIKLFRDMAHSRREMQGAWMGTIEQSLVLSMSQTFGEKDPLFSGIITLPGFDYQVQINRSHAITGQRFVLPLIERKLDLRDLFEASILQEIDIEPESAESIPTDYHTRWYLIEGKRFTPGTDYNIRDPQNGNRKVGSINGKMVDIGGKWEIVITDDALASDPLFRANIILFTCLVKFHPEAQKVMRRLYKELKRKVKQFSDDELRAMLSMYLDNLEKKRKEKFDDKTKKIEFALKLLKTSKYSNAEIMDLLRLKYDMHITPHELSMIFNPRRVRS